MSVNMDKSVIDGIFQENKDRIGENRSALSYNQLRLTPEDQTNIGLLISDLALDSIWSIIPVISEMKELGNKIWGVHVLKQLECSLTNADLKKKIQTIYNYSTYSFVYALAPVRNGFLYGLVPCLEANESKDTLRFLDDFTKAIHKESKKWEMEKCIRMKNWEEFFRLVILD